VEELALRESPIKLVVLLLCALGFVSLPFLLAGTQSRTNQVILWFGATFFGLCAIQVLRVFISNEPPMKFSQAASRPGAMGYLLFRGAKSSRLGFQEAEAWTFCALSCETLKRYWTGSVFRKRSAQMNRKPNFGDVCLATTGMTPGFRDMLQFVRRQTKSTLTSTVS